MKRRAGPGRRVPSATLLFLAALAAALAFAAGPPPPASASDNLLDNPSFAPPVEDAWGLSLLEETPDGLRLGSTLAFFSQYVPASPGSRYDARVTLAASATLSAQLRVEFWNTSGPISAATVISPVTMVGETPVTLTTASPSAPPGTQLAAFIVEVRGSPGTILRPSGASLTESAGNPTPTPTATPTSTPTPTLPGPGGSDVPGDGPAATRTP
ncbi:MAG: hypothetical protein WHT63_09695, partial [Tepidiforma sp.]